MSDPEDPVHDPVSPEEQADTNSSIQSQAPQDDADLYSEYVPNKELTGCPHPDKLVQTSTLASILSPKITTSHHLQEVVKLGHLSAPQLESVLHAMQKFTGPKLDVQTKTVAGFLLGDGAGVGKGRQVDATWRTLTAPPPPPHFLHLHATIYALTFPATTFFALADHQLATHRHAILQAAAVIYENWLTAGSRRVLWLSACRDLKDDGERDLGDLQRGTKLPKLTVYPAKNESLPKGRLDSEQNKIRDGVLFVTYSLLVSNGPVDVNGQIRHGSRLDQVHQWLRADGGDDAPPPIIIFDECHKAKNLVGGKGKKGSKAAQAVVALQQQLPSARVLYASATASSDLKDLAYMVRLGGVDESLLREMKHSKGASEICAIGLKATGSYICRTLSFEDADFGVEKVKLVPSFRFKYDRAAEWWQVLRRLVTVGKQQQWINPANCGTGCTYQASLYWGAHQRFELRTRSHALLIMALFSGFFGRSSWPGKFHALQRWPSRLLVKGVVWSSVCKPLARRPSTSPKAIHRQMTAWYSRG
jgi:hypothetical protein